MYVEHRKSSPCQMAFNRSFGELSSKRGGNCHWDEPAYLASIVAANLKTQSLSVFLHILVFTLFDVTRTLLKGTPRNMATWKYCLEVGFEV